MFVELGVKAIGDDPAITDHHGRVLDQGTAQRVGDFWVRANMRAQVVQCAAALYFAQLLLKGGEGHQGVTQAGQIPRASAIQCDPGQNAFDVAHIAQGVAQRHVSGIQA